MAGVMRRLEDLEAIDAAANPAGLLTITYLNKMNINMVPMRNHGLLYLFT